MDNDISEMLKETLKELNERMSDMEQNPEKYHIEGLAVLPDEMSPGIYWNVVAEACNINPQLKACGDEKRPVVKLSWGWDAGMTDEEKANMAKDAPRGEMYMVTSIDGIKGLYQQLGEIIEKYH